MLLAGDRDVEAGAVSFRFGDRSQVNGVPRDEAVEAIASWIANRENAAPTAELIKVGAAARRDAKADDETRRRSSTTASASPTTCSGCGRRTG